ncbi:hypothetical protein BGW41_001579 [Actinomortierella wolfii]|nr:hypothetical protein BGW41_001579 [Actinomortierella wolfii]
MLRRALDQNWASATPQSVTILEGHSSLVTSLELSLWTLVTASLDSTVRVWNLKTFECIQVLRCKHSITCVTQCDSIGVNTNPFYTLFLPMCQQHYRALIVWDIKTGQVILQDNDALPQIASFMWMNEQYIGYGTPDGSVTIFDWSSRSELRVAGSYQEHTGDVIHVSMLGNQIVISASTSGEALLYSLPKRRLIGRFLLPGAAQSIQFTPTISGNKVMFSTREAVYEYELDIQELVASFSQEVQREEDMEAQRRLTGKSSGPSLESAPSPSSSSSSSSSPLSSSSSSLSSPLSASSLSSPCANTPISFKQYLGATKPELEAIQ